ncbi:MAG: translational GTPase TypA [Sandaracinaceae bacterium]|jgi:GTP-binding protein|nr:translational GTPase TypA [Sandaracinaceae bacterium]
MSEPTTQSRLRNVAIIAHVDHGKTTLVDMMLRQTGTFRTNETLKDRVMDSNDLERERGITILAKQTSVQYGDTKINIIDTPGHADFGGEVERTLMMADGAILLVDAAEGPLPQTRFVLGKALERGMPAIVVINKIDRADARPDEVLNEVFDLFCDLEASDAQADFPVLYAVGKLGICKLNMADEATDLRPLFDMIIARVPPPTGDSTKPLQAIVTNIEHDDYVGRVAIARVVEGAINKNTFISRIGAEKTTREKAVMLYTYDGLKRVEAQRVEAGDIIALAGMDDVQIGDTLASELNPVALPRIQVEEPTIKVRILVNTSAFAGQSGKWVTSRHLRDRLEKEARRNLAMRFEDTDSADTFMLYGRGELMIAILVETMRREGYEVALGMPEVVTRDIDGVKSEPVELVVVDVPDAFVGVVTTSLGQRRGQMVKMANLGFGRTRAEFRIPSRGLIGFRSLFLTETRGMGLLNTVVDGWEPYGGPMLRRLNGALVSDRVGVTTPYAINGMQPRGIFFVSPGEKVYEGQIVGEHNRPNDLDVNVVREKKLTNVRTAGRDENTNITPAKVMTIETAMEWIDGDELVEVTPDAVRIRKRVLDASKRPRRDEQITKSG